MSKRVRIVLAHGDAALRATLGGTLLDKDYVVSLAATADEALRLVAEKSPHVLVADLSVAMTAGHGLLARMRSGFPDIAVVVTADPKEIQSAVQLLREGADAYLLEPLQTEELTGLLDRMLGQRRAEERTEVRRSGESISVPGSSMEEIERDAILKTLEACGGSTSKAANVLRISSRTIQYKLKQYRAEAGAASRRLGGSDRPG